jgi:hypothetical protein
MAKPRIVPSVHYLRNDKNLIDVSITGMKLNDGRVAFGFAYRSQKDLPDKAVGGHLSIKRAVGMVHASINGVHEIVRVARTPHNKEVLKSYLGDPNVLIHKLAHLNLDDTLSIALAERTERILNGMDKRDRGNNG